MPKKAVAAAAEASSAVAVTAEMMAPAASGPADLLRPRRMEELYLDTGGMLAVDPRPVDVAALRKDREGHLKAVARENAQLLINAMWEHPHELRDDAYMLQLPPPRYRLPREKPIPEQKPQTKWEKYAESKGIQKRKRSRMVFDEDSGEYKPRFGFGSKANEEPAVIELPDQADPFEDQFEKRAQAKKARVETNQKQRLRNLADARKEAEKAKSFADRAAVKDKLKEAFAITKGSTASAGKFDEKLPDEIKVKSKGKQRKRDPVVGDLAAERERALKLLGKLHSKPVTIATRAGAKPADDSAPGAAGVGKARGKKVQTRFAPKGPSKKQKKQGVKA